METEGGSAFSQQSLSHLSALDFYLSARYFASVDSTAPLRYAARFHGHLGPWLVLGLRAGTFAARKLRASPFRLRACVFCPSRPPYTCFVDGIQVGCGCTVGKCNLRIRRSRRVVVLFERLGQSQKESGTPWQEPAGAQLELELRPEVWTELHLTPARTKKEVESLAQDVFRRPFSQLFLER